MRVSAIKFHAADLASAPLGGFGVSDVRLYGVAGSIGDAHIGNRVSDQIERLSVPTSTAAFDFLTIALAVTAADALTPRGSEAENAWARVFDLDIPLVSPASWLPVKSRLERVLDFLSGDKWTIKFRAGGHARPAAVQTRKKRIANLNGVDCVSLFSGGMDSWLGARQLLRDNRVPVLVSHAYTGDRGYQNRVFASLKGRAERFSAHASPIRRSSGHDTTMRTRSFNFIAFAAAAAEAVASLRPSAGAIPLYVPENGFIALNAPLTHRRLGSLSTRTTHPHYLAELQLVLDAVGISAKLENTYRHLTKGEMLKQAGLTDGEKGVASMTVSCGKWKRKGMQCGHCVPCIIRRSSFHAAGITDTTKYGRDLSDAISDENIHLKDDTMSMALAVTPAPKSSLRKRALCSGPLPLDAAERSGWFDVHERGLYEVAEYLRSQGVIQ